MSEPDPKPAEASRPSHMRGSAAPEEFSALPRPETLFNRLVRRLFGMRRTRSVLLEDLRPWLYESLRAFAVLRAPSHAIAAVTDSFEHRWSIADTPAPKDVWCGEVVFSEGREPLVLMYPDSPWGRAPNRFFAIATQAGVDHMVAHLLEYYSGSDYGEKAACRDQVRLMLVRRGPQHTVMAVAIAVGHRFHKRIPLATYQPALRERYLARSKRAPAKR